ncbi:MAG: hypothetical protein GX263_10280 [Firmicutes bacterium]|jgi:hypothetical protein|nr:hypothetical protein [Bacillota bacterium]
MKYKQASEDISNVDLLIFLLVRFPEIFTIKYNQAQEKFTLSFMLRIDIDHDHYIRFKNKFLTCLKAYNDLSGSRQPLIKLCKRFIKPWTLLQVTLKKERISFEEVNLISNLVLNEYKNGLVFDSRDNNNFDNKIIEKEELIEYLLPRKKKSDEENLIAFRESGKVYIYDK